MKQITFSTGLAITVAFALLIIFSGCTITNVDVGDGTKVSITKGTDSLLLEFDTSQKLRKFESAQEVMDFLQQNQLEQQRTFGYFGGINNRALFADDVAVMAVAESADSIAAPTTATKSQSASEFSETNVQVQGVDEADIVKNDGKYIYTIVQDQIVIVDAFPAEDADIVAEIEIDGNPRNMFVNGDTLVVFADGQGETFVIPRYDYFPRPRYTQTTHVFVYDISDREDPELINDFSTNGWYFQSRMIDDVVYFIAKENVYYFNNLIDLPVIRADDTVIVEPEIFYFDNPEPNYIFHTIASFSLDDLEDVNAQTFMMGHSNTLYVSEDNIYIAYQKNLPYRYYQESSKERFFDVVVPLLPADVQVKINEFEDSDDPDAWEDIARVLEAMYNDMSDREKEDLLEEIAEAIEEYDIQQAIERDATIIHKINIDDGDIDYDTRGEVPGTLLNQFSLDEYDGNLRVASNTNIWTRKEVVTHNNVFVLDDDMDTIGELRGIAPDERIFSTRFIGDRLYMVTFERIDPFFVIDLSNPKDPEILGELKIPGFSDYLHPYDENHIIGVGKETKENQWGGISTKGVKVALFDVTDVTEPELLDQYEIGDSGTDSEALRDHKAFLFSKEKDLLVIPVREVKGNRIYDERFGYYRQRVWQGAYVFSITPEDGFEVQGKIEHAEGDENYYSYYGSPSAVRRSLYMDDVLYTVSATTIKANDLDDIDEELAEVDLPYREPRYPYPTPYYEDVEIFR